MTALVRGVAHHTTPCGPDHLPEAETYQAGQRVTWCNERGFEFEATVTEIWDDCLEITLDIPALNVWKAQDVELWGRTRLVTAHELRPIDPAPRRTT